MQKQNRREVAFGGASFILGIVAILSAWGLRQGFSYDGIGPRVLPIIVGAGICVSGLVVLLSAWRSEDKAERIDINWLPVGLVSAAVLFMYFFVLLLGWIVSATVLFCLVSIAFKTHRPAATIAVGLASSMATYVVFTYGIGIRLPTGHLFSLFH